MIPFEFFSEKQVARLLRLSDVIDQVEAGFRALHRGEAENIPRFRARGSGIVLHAMAATANYLGVVGTKQYTTTRHGAQFHVSLYDQHSGQLLAIFEANRLGQQRTGAATAVAARYLTGPDTDRVGLYGTGWQAESQLEAVAAVRPIQQAYVYSRSPERRQEFASRMSERLGFPVQPVERPEDAARDLPLVITATSSRTPVLQAKWLAAETLVAAIGSNWPRHAEVENAILRTVDRVVCDQVAACQVEAGDLLLAEGVGDFAWDRAEELADVVAGNGGTTAELSGRRLFKSVGLALQDLAVAHALWLRREERSEVDED
jgi:alanine dehydrogenase